ncbi:MAG: Asp-tRNA(Asn)/Glu-tRNA(Gln) amidotransferase subunit GatC [Deltaproteobacteria bacterium]|nr:Asp-tRNA(Asn)/Glu-tRNA(Gln) amidotransferase subunit GatC [Deltaproteobacteria bacterium]
MFHERISHIAELARLDPEPADRDRFGRQGMHILGYIDVINEVDTTRVEPLHSLLDQPVSFRDDVAETGNQRVDMLVNAPETDGAFFIVPRIV